MSGFCAGLFLLSALFIALQANDAGAGNPPSWSASTIDQVIIEAESICDASQVNTDLDASGQSSCGAGSQNSNNFFDFQYSNIDSVEDKGTYRFYFRGRSENGVNVDFGMDLQDPFSTVDIG